MSAMKMLPALALLVAATPTLAAGPAGKNDVVAFKATVRVEVDAAGKPVKVEAPADLPEAIRAFDAGREPVYLDEPRKDLFEGG